MDEAWLSIRRVQIVTLFMMFFVVDF